MGSGCCKKVVQIESENFDVSNSNKDEKKENSITIEKSKASTKKNSIKNSPNGTDTLILNDAINFLDNPEKQFIRMLEDVPITDPVLRRKLIQLKPFDFESYKDASSLLIVKSDKFVNNELYFGFVYFITTIRNPILNIREYKGVILQKNGAYFIGNFSNGKMQGKGRKVMADLTVYEGNFVNNKEEGKGRCIFPSGAIYEGDWKNGKQNGYGIEILPGKQHYEGQFKNGMKNGKGICKFDDGSIYEGDFVNDKYDGDGKYTQIGGKIYEGQWKEGVENGFGILNYETGITYIGEFENGRPHGRGKLLHKDGKQVMEGNWVNGKEEGVFTITIAGQPKKTVEIKNNNIVRILS